MHLSTLLHDRSIIDRSRIFWCTFCCSRCKVTNIVDSGLLDVLKKCGIENFTRWKQVQGKGKTSGPHFASEIWPSENSVIFTAIEDKTLDNLLSHIKNLRAQLGREGVKAFSWNLEALT